VSIFGYGLIFGGHNQTPHLLRRERPSMQCKCSRTSYVLAARCATLVALVTALQTSSNAHAQQFVLVDQTYTANADNTQDSHFTAELKSGIPTNLRAPTNYANGSVHVDLEIIEAPSATDGLYNICLENSSDVACLPYVMYKGKGKYNANPTFSLFWQNEKVDWTKGVSKVSLIIKDANEQKAQGSTTYYPYKAHVTLTVVAEGSTFDPKADDSGSAGGSTMQGQAGRAGGNAMGQGGKGGEGGKAGSTGMSSNGGAGAMPKSGNGGTSTGSGGASAPAANSGGGGAATRSASGTGGTTKPVQTPTTPGTAGSSSTPTSRAAVSSGAAGSGDDAQSVSSQLEDTSGCSVSGVGSRAASSAWPWIALGLLATATRSRKRRASRRA
jgi:hypothetical protein